MRTKLPVAVVGAVASGAVCVGGCDLVWGVHKADLYVPDAGGTGTTASSSSSSSSSSGAGGAAPTCADGAKNAKETDIDCGGGTCPPCALGKGCIVGPDCESSVCLGGTCVPAGCTDKIENGLETDIDCGGTACPGCANGQKCLVSADCESGVCKNNICVDSHVWSLRFGPVNSAVVAGLAADGTGDATLAVNLDGTIDFGGAPLVSAGSTDIVVARFDSNGDHVWSTRFGDGNNQTVRGVSADTFGGVAFAGSLAGTADFGGGPITSAGGCCPASPDVIVVRTDAQGKHIWSKNSGNSSPQHAFSVAIDGSGNTVAVGNIQGSADFGGGTLTSAGQTDAFVAKFDPMGVHQWSKRYGDAQNQNGERVVFDSTGNVIVSGIFQGEIDFGGGPVTSAGGYDAFVVKLDPTGNLLWHKHYGSALDETGTSLAVDAAGNVIVAGGFQGIIDVGGGPMVSAGNNDLVVAKFDPVGNLVWSRRFGDAADQSEPSVAVDAAGNVLMAGGFLGSVDFGGGPLVSVGDSDVFVVKFDSSGKHLWSRRFGDAQKQFASGIAATGPDTVVIAGNFGGTLDFGGGSLTSTSGNDIFLAKFITP